MLHLSLIFINSRTSSTSLTNFSATSIYLYLSPFRCNTWPSAIPININWAYAIREWNTDTWLSYKWIDRSLKFVFLIFFKLYWFARTISTSHNHIGSLTDVAIICFRSDLKYLFVYLFWTRNSSVLKCSSFYALIFLVLRFPCSSFPRSSCWLPKGRK